MYHAIVFLPLLGFILAGVISLAGAHGRFPGAEASDDHHGDDHAHAAAAHGAGGDHGHGDGHGEPAALGSRTAELITSTLLFISMILSWIAFVQVGILHHDAHISLAP